MTTNSWVFDTNTLVSALLLRNGVPRQALEKAIQAGEFLVSPEIADEYFEVFSRSKFDKYVSLETRMAFLSEIMATAISVNSRNRITACRDSRDNKFLELAVTAGASAIVTGDQDLLALHPFQNITIISPADFLQRW